MFLDCIFLDLCCNYSTPPLELKSLWLQATSKLMSVAAFQYNFIYWNSELAYSLLASVLGHRDQLVNPSDLQTLPTTLFFPSFIEI